MSTPYTDIRHTPMCNKHGSDISTNYFWEQIVTTVYKKKTKPGDNTDHSLVGDNGFFNNVT